jgi:hypothetical protein
MVMTARIEPFSRNRHRPLRNLTLNGASRLADFRAELEQMEEENRRRLTYDLVLAKIRSITANQHQK